MVIAWFYLLKMVSKMAARLLYVWHNVSAIMWLLKQVIFYNSLVEKSHKDIYVTQNANLGGSKHTIQEIGQRSNECKLKNKCSIYHIRVISQ